MLRREDLLKEADEHSAAAYERFKALAPAISTRGAVLLWMGKLDEAIGLLERAYVRASVPKSRASDACCLAIAYARRGERDVAAGWLARARANHPGSQLLPEAEAALAEPTGSRTGSP